MSKVIEFRFFGFWGSMGRLYSKSLKTSLVIQNLKPCIRIKICILGYYLAMYFDIPRKTLSNIGKGEEK